MNVWASISGAPGQARVDQLAEYAAAGVRRLMFFDGATATSDDYLAALAEDAGAAGVELG